MDQQLTRLEDARDDLARRFIARLVERSSLDEIAALPTERLARELPGLIVDALRVPQDRAGEGAEQLATRLAALRGSEPPDPEEIVADFAELQSVIFEALGSGIADREARATLATADRLSSHLAAATGAAVSGVVAARSAARSSGTDPLTGLADADQMRRHLDQLLAVQARYGRPFAVVVIDLDGLRRINHSQGRAAGDRALARVAETVRSTVRSADSVSRIAGDELCVLAPEQTSVGGRAMGERIARLVAQLEDVGGAPISVSVGVASCPEHGAAADRLLELADEALYRAKAAGAPVAAAVPPLAGAAAQRNGS